MMSAGNVKEWGGVGFGGCKEGVISRVPLIVNMKELVNMKVRSSSSTASPKGAILCICGVQHERVHAKERGDVLGVVWCCGGTRTWEMWRGSETETL